MFKNTEAFSSFSVNDLTKAKEFYGTILGLTVVDLSQGLEVHFAGGMRVFIYPSSEYNPPEHTVLNFVVDDIEKTVDELAAKGVEMEQYPDFNTDARGISRDDCGMKIAAIAWFKDPADHIIALIQKE